MFTCILVPLDGSGCAAHALPVAAHLIRASGGSIILVRVVSTAAEFWPYQHATPQPTLLRTVTDADLTEAEEYLSALTKEPSLDEGRACVEPAQPTERGRARVTARLCAA